MAEATQNQKPERGTSIKWYIGILISIVVVFIIALAVNICILNNQFKTNNKSTSNCKQVNNPLKSIGNDSTKVYKLSKEDLQKFNEHIDYLDNKVEDEVKRTQENNQYDIDRINTFLAIGIGLLAIIGGLLPIFVNFFSKEHLEKQLHEVKESTKEITSAAATAKEVADKAKENADKAKDEAEKASNSIQGIESKIDKLVKDLKPLKKDVDVVKEATKKVPYIDLLVFQNAVAKLTSTDALKLFIGVSRYTDVVAYLQNLISSIDSFDNDLFENNTDFDVKYFKNVVTELKLALRLGPIRRIPDGRSFQEKIDEVVLQLSKFEKMETKNFKTQLKTVSVKLTELKTLVEHKITA